MIDHHFIYAIAGLLGIAIHTALELKGVQKKAKVANEPFVLKDYFKEDWLSIVVSLLTLSLAIFLLGDKGVDNLEGWYKDWARLIFSAIGYMGDSIASRVFGTISNRIDKAIDVKTDIADGKIRPTS